MSLIKGQGAGEVSTGFYSHLLDQSIKFNDDDAQYLSRTPASAGNRRTWTWSAWVKRGNSVNYAALFTAWSADSGDNYFVIRFDSDQLVVKNWSTVFRQTNRLFRDKSAWLHIVVAVDTTDGTADNRIKVYVNGVQETSFATNNAISQNTDTSVNNTNIHVIGTNYFGSSYQYAFDGYIAEVNFIDGSQLTPTSFGETKTGIWIPKDTSGLTFGTNGFHLTFKDDVVSEGFNTAIYEGNSTTQSISGLGFSPGLVWVKDRDNGNSNALSDVVRGRGRNLISNATNAEVSAAAATDKDLISFDADGFSVGQFEDGTYNNNGSSMVAWCWEAGGAPTADNSAGAGATPTAGSVKIDGSNLGSALAGTIPATRLSANTSKGFSIVSFTGTGSAATVAHGLGAAPDWIIVKNRDNASGLWLVYHSANTANPETEYLQLETNGATADDNSAWNDTAPTSTVFSVGTSVASNQNGSKMIAYCWTEISGYSKFGSFTGNGGSQAIDVGFTPAWVMLRRTNGSTWGIFDNTRQSRNLQMLAANSSAVETTNAQMTFSGNTFNDNGYLSDNGATVLYMAFADTREAAFFKDVTSNGNHFTPVNLDYRDSVPDVPTNNFAVLNPLAVTTSKTLSEGNLKVVTPSSGYGSTFATFAIPSSGKWYFEGLLQAGTKALIGLSSYDATKTYFWSESGVTSLGYYAENGTLYGSQDSGTSYGASYSAGDIIGVAVNADDNEVTFYKNNSSQGTDSFTPDGLFPMFNDFGNAATATWVANFGQDSSFAGNKSTANSNADGNGHGSFAYAPPSGFLALCSQNLSDPAITDGTENFNTVLYTGNATGSRAITGVGFSPDFVWAKVRSTTYPHFLANSVVGSTKYLKSNSTDAEATDSTYFTSFDSDGFTIGSSGGINGNGETFVAWNWLAGTAFSNDASATGVGTIDSEGQINTTAGFSIIKYTSPNNSSDQTVAHGLSSVPEMIITKNRTSTFNWDIYHKDTGSVQNTLIFTDAATRDYDIFTTTAPTSTVFGIKYNYTHYSTNEYIAYCFHSVEGYCKVGSYVGNANTDGPFIHTGGRVQWLLLKNASASENWYIWDNARETFNIMNERQHPNLAIADQTSTGRGLDFLSNGF